MRWLAPFARVPIQAVIDTVAFETGVRIDATRADDRRRWTCWHRLAVVWLATEVGHHSRVAIGSALGLRHETIGRAARRASVLRLTDPEFRALTDLAAASLRTGAAEGNPFAERLLQCA